MNETQRVTFIQVKLTALKAFSSAASQCNVHATFVLKQIPGLLDALQETTSDTTTPLHLRLIATAIFDSLLVLEGVEVSHSICVTECDPHSIPVPDS